MNVPRQRRLKVPGLTALPASSAGLADAMGNVLASPVRALCAAFVLAIAPLIATLPAHAKSFAYVAVYDQNKVSVINTANSTVTASVPVGLGPYGVAITPDGAFAYVTNVESHNVSVIDTASNTVTATVPVGGKSVTITPDGAFVYVVSGTIAVIDTTSNAVTTTLNLGSSANSVAFTPDGAFAYVATWDHVSVVDTASHTVTAIVPAGVRPDSVAITPDGAFAYVSNWKSNNVSVISTASNTVIATVPVGPGPRTVAITPDGAFAYVANGANDDDTVSVIDTATNTVTATVALGKSLNQNSLYGVAIRPDGAFVYVTSLVFGNVSVIKTAGNTVTAAIPVGPTPIGVAVTPDPYILMEKLRDYATDKGPGRGLFDKIALAQTYYAVPDIQATCATLDAFINQVEELLDSNEPRGATLRLATDATAVKVAIGCR